MLDKLIMSVFVGLSMVAASALQGAGPLLCLGIYGFSGIVMFLALAIVDLITDGDQDEY